MKTKRKALLLSVCIVLLVVVSAFGTLAYLTDYETVTNTFTVGRVGLKLDESYVKKDGTLEANNSRVQSNEYHLLPGRTYIKDPTVTVDANSEDAYVRMIVKVENMDQLKLALSDAKYYNADGTFLLQMLCVDESGIYTWDANTWKMEDYTESSDGGIGFYEFRYKEVVTKSETETKLPALFTRFTVPGEIDNEHLAYLANVNIVINAHAIQAAGFENNEDSAWTAFGTLNP